ncbi:unnamed protein product [Menidia menidia]|uniref:(Atlantic silverside) hypothetical protein n=1 Tax=Menidia menidia TaxID=238744 RepID=A0A8S4BUM5_9TELE|nr:unnamed protein product [Menidia menidia]
MKRTAYLNDQRDKATRTATMREHPYASHISRFAVFPSFSSPDDPQTGQTKPVKEEDQGFYPTPSKIIHPNPRLRDWNLTLSERTSNMLKNLERTQWITSYQMQYSGLGAAIPMKIDDFKEKMCNFIGMDSHSATQQAQSKISVYEGRQRENCSVWSDEHLMREPEPQNIQKADASQIANPERWPNLDSGPYSQTELKSNSRPVHQQVVDLSRAKMANFTRRQTSSKSNTGLRSEASSDEEGKTERREPTLVFSNPCILPYIQQGSRSARRTGTVATIRGDLSLLDMQNSFSKSEAHRNFNTSVTRAAANLRDNVVSGKKHNFFGINCNNIRG